MTTYGGHKMSLFKNLFRAKNQEQSESISKATENAEIDQNKHPIYNTIKIGAQEWMSQNLNVDRYQNGDYIPQVQDNEKWATLTTGAWCYSDPLNAGKYGKLYNWYAVIDPRGLAPTGYHIPNDSEWQILIDYLGGNEVAGEKMRDNSAGDWNFLDKRATNQSGFSGLPCGSRMSFGDYLGVGMFATFWTSDTVNNEALTRSLNYGNSIVVSSSREKGCGCSVRCVKDRGNK